MTDWLPPLILEGEVGGGFQDFLAAVYVAFRRDHIDTPMVFRGKLVSVVPALIDGKEASFWHLVSEGPEEENRQVKPERCRHICWPRAMLGAAETDRVLVWPDPKKERWRVSLPDFSYLVIVKERTSYCRIVTAYPVDHPHQRRKLEKHYRTWKATGKA